MTGTMSTKDLALKSGATLHSGQRVPESGIYRIAHFVQHGRRGLIVMRRDEKVPRCPDCGDSVSCEVICAAPLLADDPDFSDSADS